jgi:hypothetical protein
MENAGFHVSNFSGSWSGALVGPSWGGQLTAVLSQTGPDAQGFSQISGTFNVQGVPCFTRGTIASTTFAGDIAQMNVLMDSGELTGSAQSGSEFMAGASIATITFNFVVHGGSCDGQSATSVVRQ